MSTNITQIEAPFLRSSWDFPSDNSQVLAVQVSRSYLAIANNMNARTIGIFPETAPTSTGESWVLSGQPLSGQRQIYPFTAVSSIPHGLNVQTISYFTNCFGSFTDGTNWYGVLFSGSTTIAGQVSFYITNTNIVIQSGAGAPSVTSGIICLEWISQP